MLKTIVAAVDGSPSARKAARFALSLAEAERAKVVLLAVVPPPEVLPFGPFNAYVVKTPAPDPAELERVKAVLAEVAAERPNVTAEQRVVFGHPADTICDVARELDADLIVIGARGHGLGRRILLGSVSDRVVQHAHCPVTVWR